MNNSNPKNTIIFPGFMEHHKTEKAYIVRSFFYSQTLLLYIIFINKPYSFIMYCVENNGETLFP
jgi:hypothetical protein